MTPREPTWDDVVAEAKDGGYRLINTDELRQRYEKDPRSILLVDTRQEWEFAMGHITGRSEFPYGTYRVVKMVEKGRTGGGARS